MECSCVQRRSIDPLLLTFLCGTLQDDQPIANLRGHNDLLKIIWGLVCEEWWDLHIERFPTEDQLFPVPKLLLNWRDDLPTQLEIRAPVYPHERMRSAGCPLAVVAKGIRFPAVSSVPKGTFADQQSDYLYVNMMPFNVQYKDTLPVCCRPYWHLIDACFPFLDITQMRNGIGYLTIDERPVQLNNSQRRRGLHVESPGVLPFIEQYPGEDLSRAPLSLELQDECFVPAAEHFWGGGLMMRGECFAGGIFMASNIADTTAVWNCRINNENGDFIGAHGDIERFRDLLGPCARTLDAGELIWMTDRTPHESLPIPASAGSKSRQYFRLVIGQVSAWFADHSTPNPLGTVPPPEVRIVHGNKFTLYPPVRHTWAAGTTEAIQRAYLFKEVRIMLVEHCLGHLVQRMHDYGARSLALCQSIAEQCGSPNPREWTAAYSMDGLDLLDPHDHGSRYCEVPHFKKFLMCVSETLKNRVTHPTRLNNSAALTTRTQSMMQRFNNWMGFS